MASETPLSRPRAGRPSKGREGEATRRIIDAAIPVFLADGFEGASIDAIATAAGASKKTLYAKFSSKADLFEAACLRLIEEHMPRVDAASRSGSTEASLHAIALESLQGGLTPVCTALRRIIAAEAVRFPEFSRMLYDFAQARVTVLIERCLEDGVRRGELAIDDMRFAANVFIDVAIAPPMNNAMFGLERSELTHVKRENLRRVVATFLRAFATDTHGVDRRAGAAAP